MKRLLLGTLALSIMVIGLTLPSIHLAHADQELICNDGTHVIQGSTTGNCDAHGGLNNGATNQNYQNISSPAPAGASKCGNVTVGTPGLSAICGDGSIYGLLAGIINFVIGIIGGLAVLAIIVGGIQYITSQGNPDALKKAKSRITHAVLGLVLLTLSAGILVLIGVVH